MRINIKAFALTCGLLWCVVLFLITWWVMLLDGATGEPTLIGKCYRGYNISPLGSVVGGIWALGDGLIGGAVFAWVYNTLAERFERPASG
jgi:hypothetical protein